MGRIFQKMSQHKLLRLNSLLLRQVKKVKSVFLEISQNSLENAWSLFLIKLQTSGRLLLFLRKACAQHLNFVKALSKGIRNSKFASFSSLMYFLQKIKSFFVPNNFIIPFKTNVPIIQKSVKCSVKKINGLVSI